MRDPVDELTHDHADLNRRVLALGELVGLLGEPDADIRGPLGAALAELRDQLFLHFAREEEGLFPFVAEVEPALAEVVGGLALGHDAICGALARMVHLADNDGELSTIFTLFARFEETYALHAHNEAALLDKLARRLDAGQRERLAELVDGL